MDGVDCSVFVASQRISRDRCHLRGRSEPRGAVHDGHSTGRRGPSCKTTTLQSSRYLSDDGVAPELVDDRTSDVAFVSPTSESKVFQSVS